MERVYHVIQRINSSFFYKEQTLIIYFGILTGLVSACLKSTSGVFEVIMAEEESENNLEENNLSQPGSSKLDF